MAAPQSGYPPQGYPNQEPNGPQQPGQFENGQHPGFDGTTSPVQGAAPASSAAARRKRQYAGQAYDFGGGANAALGGQQQGGGPPGAGFGGQNQQPQQAAYSSYGYGAEQGAAAPVASPTFGQPPASVGSYSAPEAGYPAHGLAPAGVNAITHSMSNMAVGGSPQSMASRPALNQLYPTDLLNQPFNVTELDLPPPPILLPANVRTKGSRQTVRR